MSEPEPIAEERVEFETKLWELAELWELILESDNDMKSPEQVLESCKEDLEAILDERAKTESFVQSSLMVQWPEHAENEGFEVER